MDSKEFIDNIIKTRGQWTIPTDENGNKLSFDKHHILPECMGGESDYIDSKGNGRFRRGSKHYNCVYLTHEEHYLVHEMLALENPNHRGLLYGWLRISNWGKTSSKNYSYLRDKAIKNLSIKMSGKGNPMYGKNAYENKTEQEMLEISIKKSLSLSGKKRTKEQKEHYRKSKLGDNNPMKNKTGDKHHNYNKKCYTSPDGSKSHYYKPGQEPDGWICKMHYNLTNSRDGENNPAFGRHWYNNGKENFYGYECPRGYVKGMVKKNER